LEEKQDECHGRVEFTDEDGTRDVTKDKMSDGLHYPDIGQQVCHNTRVFGLLHLHL
jgi:hypothetical protein